MNRGFYRATWIKWLDGKMPENKKLPGKTYKGGERMDIVAAFYYDSERGLYVSSWRDDIGLTKEEAIAACLECLAELKAETEVETWLKSRHNP
jgi:hypothetical protein